MRSSRAVTIGVGTLCALLLAVAAAMLAVPSGTLRAQPAAQGVIGGMVQGPKGPEAGVWVIAETGDLPTNLIKIVVTDDQGRFLLPELPAASYRVWVRGYGLVDSKPVTLKPGAAQVALRDGRPAGAGRSSPAQPRRARR